MDELRADLKDVGKYLLALGGEVSGTRTELKRLESRFESMEETVQKLSGTFASIEQHMVRLFESDAALRQETASMREHWEDLARRVEALEKKAG